MIEKKHFRLRLRLSVVKIYEKSPVSLNMIHYVSNAYLNFVPWLLSWFLELKPKDTVWHNRNNVFEAGHCSFVVLYFLTFTYVHRLKTVSLAVCTGVETSAFRRIFFSGRSEGKNLNCCLTGCVFNILYLFHWMGFLYLVC